MRRKKTFVLLEIIIGITLVSISILPFLRYPFRHMREELTMLFEMQLTRYAQQRLCEVEREICEQKIDESFLFSPEIRKKKLWKEETISVCLPNGWDSSYLEKIKIYCSAMRKDNESIYSLIHIYLSFEKKGHPTIEFHTEIVAQKKA